MNNPVDQPKVSELDAKFDEVAARAWDFVKPKLTAINHEKGPAGVWSNGFRSGWTAALAALPQPQAAGKKKRGGTK